MTTATTATNGVLADTQQQLTAPVPTSLQVSPTLTFGDIGTVIETETEGKPTRMHGVGEFEDRMLLERMIKLDNIIWTVDDTTGTLANLDIDALLRAHPRNVDILLLYQLYHTDYEITIKLNTNQFYQGAIMVTLIPSTGVIVGVPPPTGATIPERAVQDPTILSAATAESVVKTWNWAWPEEWQTLHGDAASHGLKLRIDNLLTLRAAKPDMSSELDIQVWARFKNIKLSYPIGPTSLEKGSVREYRQSTLRSSQAQSHRGTPKVALPQGRSSQSPAADPLSGLEKTATNLINTVVSTPATIVDGLVGAADSVLAEGVSGLIGGLFDKPDQVDTHSTMVIDAGKDLFNCDMPANSTNVGLYKARYVDPDPSRIPQSMPGGFTLLDYAKIPGLIAIHEFAGTLAPALTLDLIKPICQPADLRTPLEYATKCCHLFRGSIKVAFMFFTSSFTTARFLVQFYNNTEDPPVDYSFGLSKVINVKGDTIDTFTIPWMDTIWWRDKDIRKIKISLASGMVSPDATADPVIGLLVWHAAADDFQFAYPSLPTAENWQPITLDVPQEESQAQAAIGQLFKSDFPAIVDDVFYDQDNGFATNESIGRMTDLAKRLTCWNPETVVGFDPLRFDVEVLDQEPVDAATQGRFEWVHFRSLTFFGAMRACFLMRSGGYHIRGYRISEGDLIWRVRQNTLVSSSIKELLGTDYPHPFDSVGKLIVPQLNSTPFQMTQNLLTSPKYGLTVVATPAIADFHAVYIGARDDVQFGYPILPTGVPVNPTPGPGKKQFMPSTEIRLQKKEKSFRGDKDNRKI